MVNAITDLSVYRTAIDTCGSVRWGEKKGALSDHRDVLRVM
jgi:hypothetical protein